MSDISIDKYPIEAELVASMYTTFMDLIFVEAFTKNAKSISFYFGHRAKSFQVSLIIDGVKSEFMNSPSVLYNGVEKCFLELIGIDKFEEKKEYPLQKKVNGVVSALDEDSARFSGKSNRMILQRNGFNYTPVVISFSVVNGNRSIVVDLNPSQKEEQNEVGE